MPFERENRDGSVSLGRCHGELLVSMIEKTQKRMYF